MEPWQVAFQQFRSWYPRHEAWGRAEKAFRSLHKAGKLPAMIILKVACKMQQQPGGCLELAYSKDGRDLRPLPASWLNAERWHDEASPRPILETSASKMGQPTSNREGGEVNESEVDKARAFFFDRAKDWRKTQP